MFIGRSSLVFNKNAIVGYGRADGLPRNVLDTRGVTIGRLPDTGEIRTYRLDDVFRLPAFYAAYPELADVPVTITQSPQVWQRGFAGVGSYTPVQGIIEATLLTGAPLHLIAEVLAHETQHLVQHREGFVGGTNLLREFDRIADAKYDRMTRAAELAREHGHESAAVRCEANANAIAAASQEEGTTCGHSAAYQKIHKQAKITYMNAPGELEAFIAGLMASGNNITNHPHLHNFPGPENRNRKGDRILYGQHQPQPRNLDACNVLAAFEDKRNALLIPKAAYSAQPPLDLSQTHGGVRPAFA